MRRSPEPDSATTVWAPGRIALGASALIATGFAGVFAADAEAVGWWMVRDALMNVLAIAVSALPVVALCRALPWQRAARGWFLPVHAVAAVAFAQLWYVVFAVLAGLAGVLGGDHFAPRWLTGPARRWQLFTAVFIYLAVAAACYLAQAARAWQRALALQAEAESAAMRAQLDPHLLHNTLHSLLELVRGGDAQADAAIDRFARLARYVSEGRAPGRDQVPLAEEWAMMHDYLALESLRLGPRVTYQLDLDPAVAQVPIPALTLQPLVENAIVHGLAPRAGPGTVRVQAAARDGALVVSVDDDGLGVAARTTGSGRGLSLVRRRLALWSDGAATLTAGAGTGGRGWHVALRLPLATRAA